MSSHALILIEQTTEFTFNLLLLFISVFVCFNSNRGFPVDVEAGARVSELKAAIGRLQGVQPEQLRVIFAGRELENDSTLQVSRLFCLSGAVCFFVDDDMFSVDSVSLPTGSSSMLASSDNYRSYAQL